MYFVEYEWQYELNSSNADDFNNGKTQKLSEIYLSSQSVCVQLVSGHILIVDLWMSFCRKYFILYSII